MSDFNFGDKLKVTVEDLDKLIEVLNKFEKILAELSYPLTIEQTILAIVGLFFTIGFSYRLGSRVAYFVTWLPVGFISLFKKDKK